MASDRHGIVAEFGEAVLVSALSRLTAFASLAEADLEDLAKLASGRRSFGAGETVCREGDESTGLFLLFKGWVASSATFADGARQLLNIHLAGDMLGTPDLAFTHRSQTLTAITPVELGILSRREIGRMFENNPRIAALLFLISQEERVTMMDRLASMGATEAVPRLAALLLHLSARVARSLGTESDSFLFPMPQQDVAALVGISQTHLNRTLQQLRRRGLVTWERGRITILDQPGLADLSGLPPRKLVHDPDWLPRPH